MSSPRPPRGKKGRDAAVSRGWMRFRRERRAGAAIFGQTEVVHSTKMSCAALAAFSSSQAGGSRDLVAAREGRANATRRRARGRRASSRCSITQSARLPSARRRSRRPRKHEISTSPRSTRGTRGAPGARQSPAARRACIQKQRAAQIRHLKQQLNEYMQVHLFALLLISSCSRSLSVCICSQLLWRASVRKPGGSSCARRRFLCSIAGKEQGQQEQEG